LARFASRSTMCLGPLVMKLDDALAGVDRLGFDTPPVIYFVEAHPHYDALSLRSFSALQQACFMALHR
jgi:hypothetical protein